MALWRARASLQAFADLPEQFVFQGHPGKSFRYNIDRSGSATWIVDLSLEEDPLKDAYFSALDLSADLADCVALLSYAPTHFELLSVAPPTSVLNVPFDIALPVGAFRRTRSTIDGGKLEVLGDRCADEGTAIALRSFRAALAAENPYRTLTELWTAAESLAERQAMADGNFVERSCEHCGRLVRSGLASQQYIRKFFERVTPSGKTPQDYRIVADDTRRLRGTLVHGGRLHDEALRQDVVIKISSLQAATAAAIVDKTATRTASHRCHHLGVPLVISRMQRVGPSARDCVAAPPVEGLDDLVFEIPAVLSFLPDEFSECQPFTMEIGLFFPMPIHELAFPEPSQE